MPIPTFPRVIAGLQRYWRERYERQVLDPALPQFGGVIHPHWDQPERGPDYESTLIAASLALGVASVRDLAPQVEPAILQSAAAEAARFLLRNLRPSDRLDLIRRHPDDSTANAFALQCLGPALLLARRELAPRDAAWRTALEPVEELSLRLTRGIIGGGFHTPNHRWVVCGALALGGTLHPEIDVAPEILSYLAETVDIDEEGFYLERSIGVYDGFVDRSLLLVDEYFPKLATTAGARECALANLRANLWLINADGTVETGLSHRQDKGSAAAGLLLMESYLYAAARVPETAADFLAAASLLLEQDPERALSPFFADLYLRFGEFPQAAPARPRGQRYYPENGVVRIQEERLDATFFRGDHRLGHLKFGNAEVSGIKIEQAYFGSGAFMAEDLEVRGDQLKFESMGRRVFANWPGYDLPAGEPVPRERFYSLGASDQRRQRQLPRCHSRVTVTRQDGAFLFHYQTLAGPERTLVQMAVDFAPGGLWETADTLFKPAPGQHIHLKNGVARMRYGADVIEIGPGHYTHSSWAGAVPDLAGPGDLVRVLFTFETPIDFTLSLKPVWTPV